MLITLSSMIVVSLASIRRLVSVSIIALQLQRLSYLTLAGFTLIDFSDGPEGNALASIFTRLLGMLISLRDSQSMNTYSGRNFSDSGRLIDSKETQFWYLQPVITQYFASNKSEIWS